MPSFAIVEAFHNLYPSVNLKVVYVGSSRGLEKQLVEKQRPQWIFKSIQVGKLRRYLDWKNFFDPFKVIIGFFQSLWVIWKEKPDLVFSKGGFVGVPVIWAAFFMRKKIILHESDITPSLSSKLCSFCAQKVCVSFEETLKFFLSDKGVYTGLPMRQELFEGLKEKAIQVFKLNPQLKTILVFGGSLGAKSLNEKLIPIIKKLLTSYQFIHITGQEEPPHILAAEPNYHYFKFLNDDMPLAYAVADLAIARAGASSCFELKQAQIPMILFPLGLEASRGDQILNAKEFVSKGYAVMFDQNTFKEEDLVSSIENCLSGTVGQAMKNQFQKDAGSNPSLKVAEIFYDTVSS